jgi:hypothetical protein
VARRRRACSRIIKGLHPLELDLDAGQFLFGALYRGASERPRAPQVTPSDPGGHAVWSLNDVGMRDVKPGSPRRRPPVVPGARRRRRRPPPRPGSPRAGVPGHQGGSVRARAPFQSVAAGRHHNDVGPGLGQVRPGDLRRAFPAVRPSTESAPAPTPCRAPNGPRRTGDRSIRGRPGGVAARPCHGSGHPVQPRAQASTTADRPLRRCRWPGRR